MLEAEKVGLLVWSPLAGGLLSGKFSRTQQKPTDSRRSDYDFPIVDKERTWNILDVMAPIAKAHGCSPARVSLAWLLARPVVTSVIIGAKRLDQLQDNLAAVELTFTEDEVRQLDEVSVLPPEYPGWALRSREPTACSWLSAGRASANRGSRIDPFKSSRDYQQIRYRLGNHPAGQLLANRRGRGVSIEAGSGTRGKSLLESHRDRSTLNQKTN